VWIEIAHWAGDPVPFHERPHREVGRLVLRSGRTTISSRNRLCLRGSPPAGAAAL